MNTIHDLRATLDQHAEDLEDVQRHARVVAVRRRVRSARRRRSATTTVAAVAVVIAAVAAVGTLRSPATVEPAAPTVVGIDVPETWSVLEFPYTLDQTATFRGDRDEVVLGGDENDPARAVALFAAGLGSGSATLYSDGEPVARVLGGEGEEGAALPVPVASTETTLSVRFDGASDAARAGLAVYTATDQLPAGVSNGTAVFRQVVSGAELVEAGFSEEDSPAVTFTFRGRLDEARFASYCVAAESDLRFNLEVDGDGPFSGSCQRTDDRDAGTSWAAFTEETGAARVHTVRAYLTRGGSDEPVSSPGSVLGAAVYRQPSERQEAAGTTVDSTTEYAGRIWRLVRVIDRHDLRLVADRTDLLLGFAAQGDMVYAGWDGELSSGRSTYISSPGDTATLMGGVLLRGDTYDVRLVSDQGGLTRGALLVYRPL